MRYIALAALVLILFPSYVGATGFAKQSLFLSKTPVTEGDTVLIHAVVENDTTASFTGTVVFAEGTDKIGVVAVTIAAGGANAVSVSWKPTAGSHTIEAQLTGKDGSVVEKESATFTINEKPKPASSTSTDPELEAAIESSQNIQNEIGQYSPAAASTTAPAFAAIDSLRAKAADALDSGIAWGKSKTGGKSAGEVLGDATTTVAVGGVMGAVWTVLGLIVLYICTLLRFVVGSAGAFYPLLTIVFFYILWRTYKRFRRPKYE